MKAIDAHEGFTAIVCKGCDEIHYVATGKKLPNGHGPWKFNGNYEMPTFQPSVNIHWAAIPERNKPERRCHFIVTNGAIFYCNDCTHPLAGQTIELPEITEEMI